jgi:hypothetical protein
MVKNERFQELDGRRFLVLRFDGQNQTRVRVGWAKMDLSYLVTHVQFLFFSGTRGRRRTMSEGRWGRTSGHPQLEHHRDPSCHEPPAQTRFYVLHL